MEPGSLSCFTFQNGTKIAVDYCESVGETKGSAKFFNFNPTKANMITTGKWEIPDYPHYAGTIDFVRDVLFRFYIKFDNDVICGCIIQKRERVFIYFHSQTKEIEDENAFIFSTELNDDPRKCVTFAQGETDAHKLINRLIRTQRVFFSTNKVGEIFNNYKKWQQKYSLGT